MIPISELSLVPLQSDGGSSVFGTVFFLVVLVIALGGLAGRWKVFKKAGQPGWASIIPIYNTYITLKIGDNEWWWLILMLVPLVNIYALYRMNAGVADAFGQGIGFALGLFFLGFVFWPLLGFGDYDHRSAYDDGTVARRSGPSF